MTPIGAEDSSAPVAAAEHIVDGDTIILTDFLDAGAPGEVIRRSPEGWIRWTRRPADEGDYFVALHRDGGSFVATSWRGLRYRLSPDGEIEFEAFVK
jgi:hypothetical protein